MQESWRFSTYNKPDDRLFKPNGVVLLEHFPRRLSGAPALVNPQTGNRAKCCLQADRDGESHTSDISPDMAPFFIGHRPPVCEPTHHGLCRYLGCWYLCEGRLDHSSIHPHSLASSSQPRIGRLGDQTAISATVSLSETTPRDLAAFPKSTLCLCAVAVCHGIGFCRRET